MDQDEIARIFKGIFTGPNVMTPYRIKLGDIHDTLVYEISEGTGLNNRPLYGVTFLQNTGFKYERCLEIDAPKSTYGEALTYIDEITEELKQHKFSVKSLIESFKP